MAVKFFEKPVNAEDFGKLNNFEMFKKENYSKDIYMKIAEICLPTFEGCFPKNANLWRWFRIYLCM